jgi:hypothetical protein
MQFVAKSGTSKGKKEALDIADSPIYIFEHMLKRADRKPKLDMKKSRDPPPVRIRSTPAQRFPIGFFLSPLFLNRHTECAFYPEPIAIPSRDSCRPGMGFVQ